MAAALCALLPALTFWRNLRLYRRLPELPGDDSRPAVSLLIPARDEERTLGAALAAALRSEGVDLEIVVLDDQSRDGTAGVVAGFVARDRRIRLETAPPLPAGWCGKQHACAVLAQHARHPVLVFADADVRLAPDALARGVAFLEASGAGLVSGFPRQETATLLERMLIPLMHFVLLGFLPMARMRQSVHPAYGAGCGQLFFARREAYERAGGHAAIGGSLHDGLALPRAFRRAGFATDLFDATDIAACRMYSNAGEVWRGLAKNAVEGVASPGKILPVTALLFTGQVLPPVLLLLLLAGLAGDAGLALAAAFTGTAAVYLPRLAAARRFRQPLGGALLHPVSILLFLAIQWQSLARHLLGRPASWKGRPYDCGSGGPLRRPAGPPARPGATPL